LKFVTWAMMICWVIMFLDWLIRLFTKPHDDDKPYREDTWLGD